MQIIPMYCDEYVDLVNELDRVGYAVFHDLSFQKAGSIIEFYEVQDCYDINREDGSTIPTRRDTGKKKSTRVMFSRESETNGYDVYVARIG